MLKNLFRIPGHFDADTDQRIKILTIALAVVISLAFVGMVSAMLLLACQCLPEGFEWAVLLVTLMALLAAAALSWQLTAILRQSMRVVHQHAKNTEIILNTVKDGILLLDGEGNFVAANRALTRMLPEEKLKEINTLGFEETLEWKHTVFSVTASSLPEMGSVVVFRDETRRHEADRAKDALLSTVSHEFRTPLGSVMNYIELLMQLLEIERIDPGKFMTYLMRAHENSRRLLRLVNNVIDQAQLQAGGIELQLECCDIRDVLEKPYELLAGYLEEKHLAYTLTIAPDVPPQVMSDSERLHQILLNLIGNAIKFTQRGGITVKVWLADRDTLSIEVTDTGPGIPAEQMPDIFEAFRRGSNYAQRHHQGAGLGLSISKELVKLMGGDISAESTLGVGSVFTVSLPLILVPAAEGQPL